MGGPLICDLCEDPTDPVLFLVTAVENGDTITIGAACMPAWALATTEALYPSPEGEPAGLADAGVSIDGGEAGDGAEAPAPAKRARKASKAATATTTGEASPETAAG